MSQEHEQPKSETVPVSDEIRTEAAPFEPGYQPETLPQISVPDLPEDAQGLSAEALAQVPTLTELVDGESVEQVKEADKPETSEPSPAQQDSAVETLASEETLPAPIQDTPPQADTWGEELQARMGKLTDDIHTLNARLDRLEERSKTKV